MYGCLRPGSFTFAAQQHPPTLLGGVVNGGCVMRRASAMQARQQF